MSSAKKRYGMCMVYTNRMMIVLCFCMGASLVATYVKIVNSQTIERMKMNDQKNMQKNAGQFIAYDKQGTPVIIEWQKTTLFAPAFATAMKAVWPLARKAYTPVEMQFLRAFPQVVGTEDYFKPFELLFKDGLNAVDWAKAEKVMETLLKSHFIFEASTFGAEVTALYAKDICYIVTIKDQKTAALRGFITFMMRANYAHGDIKVMSFAVDQAHQNRGLGKLLMSSILAIAPMIQRIFLCTRVTNDNALKSYQSWGFTKDMHPVMDHAFNLEHWTFLEYKLDENTILQKTAATLK